MVSAVFVSPAAVSASFNILVPAIDPRATATTEKAIQPKRAVFQCPALQRPARAATLNLIAPPFAVGLLTPDPCLRVTSVGGRGVYLMTRREGEM